MMQSSARQAAASSGKLGCVRGVLTLYNCSKWYEQLRHHRSVMTGLRQQQQILALPRSFLPQPCACRSRFFVACSTEVSTVELEVKVEGMKCGGCSSRVEAALKAMDHVKGVQVDLDTKLATVEVEAPNLIDAMNMLPTFVEAIKNLGFEAEAHIEYQA